MRRSATRVAAASGKVSSKKATNLKGNGSNDKQVKGPGAGRGRRKRGSDLMMENDADATLSYFAPDRSQPTSVPPALSSKLNRAFYDKDTIQLAKDMLGKVLCRKLPGTSQVLRGTIVETEAYPGEGDAASRSFKGVPTPSSAAMFMDPGTAYVYFTYGMYYCFNISSKDNGGACLLRAVEVQEDYEIMHNLRRPKKKAKDGEESSEEAGQKKVKRLKPHELANGPAKICLAFNITRDSCDKIDMTVSDDLWLEISPDEVYRTGKFETDVSRRVGIDSTPPVARNRLYRFFIKDKSSVSKAKFKDNLAVSKNTKSSRVSKRKKE